MMIQDYSAEDSGNTPLSEAITELFQDGTIISSKTQTAEPTTEVRQTSEETFTSTKSQKDKSTSTSTKSPVESTTLDDSSTHTDYTTLDDSSTHTDYTTVDDSSTHTDYTNYAGATSENSSPDLATQIETTPVVPNDMDDVVQNNQVSYMFCLYIFKRHTCSCTNNADNHV